MAKRKTILGIPKCGQPTSCAPYAPPCCSALELLCEVYDHFSTVPFAHPVDGPGHSHDVPGVWDADGTPCSWCATWSKVRQMTTQNPTGHILRSNNCAPGCSTPNSET